jgi:hypothetical protein
LSNSKDIKIGFIIGSPRSGTTLLGDILNLHPQISRWYEPYFIIDRYFRAALDDTLKAEDADPEVKRYIIGAFRLYQQKTGCDWIIDKSPRNSLKIPFLREIFPSAKFIHLVRDGRDAILSINREWNRRDQLIGVHKRPFETLQVVMKFANRQTLWRHKIGALLFESGGIQDRLSGKMFLHKLRWGNRVGWGPRFQGWQELIDELTLLEFNTEQWVHCVRSILDHQGSFLPGNYHTLRYENLLVDPQSELRRLAEFMGINPDNNLFNLMPELNRTNFGKWKTAFSSEEIAQIAPRMTPLLKELGYVNNDYWYV